ncbi:unnamed protein product [Symbiodinium sp. KB8]|nr:unnamed protein product [Symbiodinium sp. KB8]
MTTPITILPICHLSAVYFLLHSSAVSRSQALRTAAVRRHSLLVLTLHQSQLTIHSTRPITDDLIEVLQAIGFAVPGQTRLRKKARMGGA